MPTGEEMEIESFTIFRSYPFEYGSVDIECAYAKVTVLRSLWTADAEEPVAPIRWICGTLEEKGTYIGVKIIVSMGRLITAKKARSTIKTDFSIPYRRHCKRIEGILRKIQNIFAKMIGVSTPSLDSRRAAFGA